MLFSSDGCHQRGMKIQFLNVVSQKQMKNYLYACSLALQQNEHHLHFPADFPRVVVLFRMRAHTSTSRVLFGAFPEAIIQVVQMRC